MANSNSPFGFRPTMIDLQGGPVFTHLYGKPATDSQAIFAGDMCIRLQAAVPSDVAQGPNVPVVQSAYASGTPGTSNWIGASINFGAASALSYHWIIDDPNAVFAAQYVADATSITTASHVGKNANINVGTAGNALSGLSGMGVGTIATTATLDLRLFAVSPVSPNAEGSYAILEVIINKHELNKGTSVPS